MKTTLAVTVLLAAVVFSGCATNQAWVHDTPITTDQFNMDREECRREASVRHSPDVYYQDYRQSAATNMGYLAASLVANAIKNAAQEAAAFASCMAYKPAAVKSRILELVGDLPRIELFARKQTPGWDVWGNGTVLVCVPI